MYSYIDTEDEHSMKFQEASYKLAMCNSQKAAPVDKYKKSVPTDLPKYYNGDSESEEHAKEQQYAVLKYGSDGDDC